MKRTLPPDRSLRVKPIASLARALDLLAVLRSREVCTLGELHAASGLPKASLLRILKTLEAAGLASRRLADGAWIALEPDVPRDPVREGRAALLRAAAPVLADLAGRLEWPSDLAVCDGATLIVVDSNRSLVARAPFRRLIGERAHMLWSALGRTYLAFCPRDERDAILTVLAASRDEADRAARRREWVEGWIAETRAAGYAMRDPRHTGPMKEWMRPQSAIAVPVMRGQNVVACLNCVWPADTLTRSEIERRVVPRLRRAATALARSLPADVVTARDQAG